jgi:hypothetical protein
MDQMHWKGSFSLMECPSVHSFSFWFWLRSASVFNRNVRRSRDSFLLFLGNTFYSSVYLLETLLSSVRPSIPIS